VTATVDLNSYLMRAWYACTDQHYEEFTVKCMDKSLLPKSAGAFPSTHIWLEIYTYTATLALFYEACAKPKQVQLTCLHSSQ
jgi:hypothetical protein